MRPYAADASSTFFNMQMWNSSFRARKRRNSISVQSSMTLQSWSVWIMVTATARSSNPKPRPSITGQRSPLKQHGQRGPRRHQLGRACMKRWRATEGGDGCSSLRFVYMTACVDTPVQRVYQPRRTRALTRPWANRTGFCRPAHAMGTCAQGVSARLAWNTLAGIDTGSAPGINTAHLFTLNSSSSKCSIWIKPFDDTFCTLCLWQCK